MSGRPIRRVCVLWARFGPYHTARLAALHRFLGSRGVDLVAIETASADATYAWAPEADTGAFTRDTLFRGREYESVPAVEIDRAVACALDRHDPDAVAVASYSTPDARAALAWCRRHRRVAVMLFDSRREDAPRSAWREAPKRVLVRQFDAALVGGSPHRTYATELGVPQSHVFTPADVVDNGYFQERADAVRAAPDDVEDLPGLGGPAPFFLSSNRFIERKGLPTLLHAYAAYRSEASAPWRLVLLGDGPLRGPLEHMASDTEGVTFAGFLQIQDLPVYYARAGAYVHPALADQWGLVVNEAMAAGLPVIVSTGAGCAPDLVDKGGNGFTVPPDDPAALADRLRQVAALSPSEREAMGARSREIIAGFGLEEFAEGLWSAVHAGRSRSARGLSLPARVVIGALRLAARRPQSFHAIPD